MRIVGFFLFVLLRFSVAGMYVYIKLDLNIYIVLQIVYVLLEYQINKFKKIVTYQTIA